MIRIAICDDQEEARRAMERQIIQIQSRENLELDVYLCGNAGQLLEAVKTYHPDLVLLDIEMEGRDGLETAAELGVLEEKLKVLFVTNLEYLVFEALKLHPYGFVRKSRLQEDMDRYMQDFLEEYRKDHELCSFDGKENTIEILPGEISYLETYGHQVILHRTDGSMLELKARTTSLDRLEERLSRLGFIRCHKSYLVNCREIYAIGNDRLELRKGDSLPVSHRRIAQVKREFMEWKRK